MHKIGRKIEAMHYKYGQSPLHKCGDCPNFIAYEYCGKRLFKCLGYGDTRSESSDWRKSWTACRHYNQPFPKNERSLIECLTRPAKDNSPADGQIKMEELT